jgi:hypothetical protein
MIKGFQRPATVEPINTAFQLRPALWAGFIAGVILMIVPSGSPWSGIIFFAPVVVGRIIPAGAGLPIAAVWVIHLVVSLVYGVLISLVVNRFHRGKALLAGAICGAILYMINIRVVAVFWPNLKGNELAIAFAHVVFGLIAAGAYRGLLRQPVRVEHTKTAMSSESP